MGKQAFDHHVTRAWLDEQAEAERPKANYRLALLIIGYGAGVGVVIAIGFVWFLVAALGVLGG